jgi:hypothetical protein
MEKPIFKWAWEKINTGDYTDIKSYNAAMKEYNKIKQAIINTQSATPEHKAGRTKTDF